jgi:hypothetical protein
MPSSSGTGGGGAAARCWRGAISRGSRCIGGGSRIIGGGSRSMASRGAASRAGASRGAGSGCSGQLVPSPSGTARGSASAAVGGRAGAASRGAPAARTMFGSITTSLGPPIIKRCSTLSRRIRTRRRRPSTVAASITASRGWRPRAVEVPSRSAPNQRTTQKNAPSSATRMMMAPRTRTGVDTSRLSNIAPPCAPGAWRVYRNPPNG